MKSEGNKTDYQFYSELTALVSVVNSAEWGRATGGGGHELYERRKKTAREVALPRERQLVKIWVIALHFAIENQVCWNHHERVKKRELKVRNAGNSDPLVPLSLRLPEALE